MVRLGGGTMWADVQLNRAEKYVLNLKYLQFFAWIIRPFLKIFSNKILRNALVFLRAMCSNCYMRFFCASYFFATIGIDGTVLLNIYRNALHDCPRIKKGEGLFHYSSDDKLETGVGFRIPSVKQSSENSSAYLKYFEVCLKCPGFQECYLPLLPFTADKLLTGMLTVFKNCERMRNQGMCWKAKRETMC